MAEPLTVPQAGSGRPAAGEVQLWLVPLDIDETTASVQADELDPAERDRAGRFHRASDARKFIAGRAAVRRVLGRYRGRPGRSLRFELGPFGKPRLVDDPDTGRDEPALYFNFSRSADRGVLAVAGLPLGVDLEERRRHVSDPDVARRFFAEAEQRELASTPAAERDAAFLRCWTRKEAYLKYVGTGLTLPLDSFVVTLDSDRPALVQSDTRPDDPDQLAISDLSHHFPGYICALAHHRSLTRLTVSREPIPKGDS